MTEAEAKSLGLTLCDDICLIEKSGKPILLSHGDLFVLMILVTRSITA